MSMKYSSDIIGNRTRNLLVCSTVPQPRTLSTQLNTMMITGDG